MSAKLHCDHCDKVVSEKSHIELKAVNYPNPGPYHFCGRGCVREWVELGYP
jgi:hypothetical protein